VHEAATVAIIMAQVVLRDNVHLFALLDRLADNKKNLPMYLIYEPCHLVHHLPPYCTIH